MSVCPYMGTPCREQLAKTPGLRRQARSDYRRDDVMAPEPRMDNIYPGGRGDAGSCWQLWLGVQNTPYMWTDCMKTGGLLYR